MTRDNQCGTGTARRCSNEFHSGLGIGRIEAGGRFVGEHKRWLRDDRARDRNSLLLSDRKPLDPSMQIAHAEPFKCCLSADARAIQPRSAQHQRHQHILESTKALKKLECLEHHSNVSPSKNVSCAALERTDVCAADEYGSSFRCLDARQKMKQRGLPATRRTRKEHLFTSSNIESCDLQRKAAVVAETQPTNRNTSVRLN